MRTREENRKYMFEYRRRPGNMEKHNSATREWKRKAWRYPEYRLRRKMMQAGVELNG